MTIFSNLFPVLQNPVIAALVEFTALAAWTGAIAVLVWFAIIPEETKRKLLANNEQGRWLFAIGATLITLGLLSAAKVFVLNTLDGTQSLNGLFAVWAATLGGVAGTYGFFVMLPDHITDRMYRQKYEWVYPLLGLLFAIAVAIL